MGKLCNTCKFIDGLNSIKDGGEFESNYCKLGKGNTEKRVLVFWI